MEAHQGYFGQAPRGMWPSEGSVCPEMLPVLARHGIRWFATDEAILARSLGMGIERDPYGHVNNPHVLYQPYAVGDSPQLSVPSPQSLAAIFRVPARHALVDKANPVRQGVVAENGGQ